MIRHIPKAVRYYAGAAGALWSARAAVGLNVGMTAVGAVCVALVPLVFVFLKIEERYRNADAGEGRSKNDDGAGFILSLADALKRVRFADPWDEAIAEQANNLVRKELDKRCISYKGYREIRRKNRLVFAAIVSEENELLGFFDVFPLTDEAAAGIIEGKKRDSDIGIDDIAPGTRNSEVEHLYIATILCNPSQKSYPSTIAREIVSLKLYEYLLTRFAPIEKRTLMAYAHTKAGQRLLEKARFSVRVTAEESVQRRPLFVLDASRAEAVRDRYEAICTALAALEGRKFEVATALTAQPSRLAAI